MIVTFHQYQNHRSCGTPAVVFPVISTTVDHPKAFCIAIPSIPLPTIAPRLPRQIHTPPGTLVYLLGTRDSLSARLIHLTAEEGGPILQIHMP